MENATQALLIAGGILFAILTLSLVVFLFSNMNTIGTAQANKKDAEYLEKWNAEWEAYNKKLLHGSEVLTVINKAEQNNIDNENDEKYIIEVKVFENNVIKTQIDEKGQVTGKNYFADKKTKIFECTKMELSNETGRVKWIEFKYIE